MKKLLLGSLLVAGTCIGGGILGLPVLTAQTGFVPTLALFAICWFTMSMTALLYLEAVLWMEGDTNIISMAGATLGSFGRSISWVLYLFLFYCLTLAYMDGCGNLLEDFLNHAIPDWSGPIFFTLLFAPFIFLGARSVSLLNAIFMAGLIVTYFAFIYFGWGHIQMENLERIDWSKSLRALPIILLSFGFQGIVPTLARYMDFDGKKARIAILIGSLIPLIAYAFWQMLILGIMPLPLLDEAKVLGISAVMPLRYYLDNPLVATFGAWFAFFALTTSFFGVTLGLRDFLADGLEIEKDRRGKFILCLMIFIPPLIFAVMTPRLFIRALDFAGIYGGTLLLGLLPICIAWSGRYLLQLKGERLVPGGKLMLSALALFLLFVLFFS